MSNAHSSPFKFLDSYGQEDQDIFFGREKEVDEAFDKLFQSKMLLVYGASGTGKSSIINCGVANKFQSSDWMPIHIRRGGDILKSFYQQIAKQSVQEGGLEFDREAVHESYHRLISSVYLDHFKPMYFIFDQFEELFIFGDQREWEQFIGLVKYLMHTDLEIRFIFVVRGEYLEFLAEFEEDIPEFFDNRIRIEKMTRKNAEKVISGPAEVFNIQLEEGFENTLLSKVSGNSPYVELTFLQVFLDKLYHTHEEASILKISAIEQLGEMGDVLAEFVDEQLFKMKDSSAALMVLKSFVSLKGTKNRMSLEDVVIYTQQIGHPLALSIVDDIISSFVNKRILKDKDDSGYFELRHDSLAQKIYEKISYQERELLEARQFISYRFEEFKKRGTLLNEEDLGYYNYHEKSLSLAPDVLAFIEESKSRSSKKKKQDRQKMFGVAVIVLFLITSLIGLFYSLQQRQNAVEQAELAIINAEKAENSRLEAERQGALALENAEEASTQAENALRQQQLAEDARTEAEKQRNIAVQQQIKAEEARLSAVEAQKVAESNREEAEKQRRIAQTEEEKANQLRLMTTARELALRSVYQAEPDKAAQMAMVSYLLHNRQVGSGFQNEIFQSLLLAYQGLIDQPSKVFDQPISSMAMKGDKLMVVTAEQKSYELDKVGEGTVSDTEIPYAEIFELHSGQTLSLSTTGEFILDEKTIPYQASGDLPLWAGISRDQKGLLIAYVDGRLEKIDFDGRVIAQQQLGSIIAVDQSVADHKISVLHSEDRVTIVDDALQVVLDFDIAASSNAKKIHFSPSAKDIWLGFENGHVSRFILGQTEPVQTLVGHNSIISDIYYDAPMQQLITAGYDRKVILWDLSDQPGVPVQISELEGWVTDMVVNVSNNQLIVGTSEGHLYDVRLDMGYYFERICEKVSTRPSAVQIEQWVGQKLNLNVNCNE